MTSFVCNSKFWNWRCRSGATQGCAGVRHLHLPGREPPCKKLHLGQHHFPHLLPQGLEQEHKSKAAPGSTAPPPTSKSWSNLCVCVAPGEEAAMSLLLLDEGGTLSPTAGPLTRTIPVGVVGRG